MKKLLILTTLPFAMFMFACGGSEEGEGTENDADSTQVENTDEGEELADIAFNGVDKDGYVLYGHTDVDAEGAVSTGDMMASWEETGEWKGKVTVEISEVCQKAGCWITYNDDFGDEVRVFFQDHFGIPTETAQGTEAILYGSPFKDTLTVDFQKHLMEDALEEGEELDEEAVAALEPKLITSFDCESILIKQ